MLCSSPCFQLETKMTALTGIQFLTNYLEELQIDFRLSAEVPSQLPLFLSADLEVEHRVAAVNKRSRRV